MQDIHDPHTAEYDFEWHDKAHPVDDYRDEEERMQKWAEEEKEILQKAVTHEERKENWLN